MGDVPRPPARQAHSAPSCCECCLLTLLWKTALGQQKSNHLARSFMPRPPQAISQQLSYSGLQKTGVLASKGMNSGALCTPHRVRLKRTPALTLPLALSFLLSLLPESSSPSSTHTHESHAEIPSSSILLVTDLVWRGGQGCPPWENRG